MFKFEVTILGSSSATPIFNRHPTSQWVHVFDTQLLLDCGEATQIQISKYGLKASKLRHIFISHLHGDHYLGLVGLLSSMNLNGRLDELNVYAPPALSALVDHHFAISATTLRFPLVYHATLPVDPEEEMHPQMLLDQPGFVVSTIPLKHSIPCCGFLIREKPKPIKINQVQEPTRAYAFCSDTIYLPALATLLKGVSTLYHEATFDHRYVSRAETTFHTTAFQAATLALHAGVGKLLIGHFSARYRDLAPLLEEATQVFAPTFLAVEGTTFEV